MKLIIIIISLITLTTICSAAVSEKEKNKKQILLDKICEDARHIALAPRRLKIYKECIIEYSKKYEQFCTELSKHYNGERVNAAPRHYDLPECKVAFAYSQKLD